MEEIYDIHAYYHETTAYQEAFDHWLVQEMITNTIMLDRDSGEYLTHPPVINHLTTPLQGHGE